MLKSLAVTPSGALSPGPLSAGAIAIGGFTGFLGGLAVAFGHTLAELPYVLFLVRFVGAARRFLSRFALALNLVIAVFLLFFSLSLFIAALESWRGFLRMSIPSVATLQVATLYGVALTILNPYFLLWWLTVGYTLVEDASKAGYKGVIVMYLSHVWMDYAWLGALAWSGGVYRLLGLKAYSVLLTIISLILAYFAARFLADALRLVKQNRMEAMGYPGTKATKVLYTHS